VTATSKRSAAAAPAAAPASSSAHDKVRDFKASPSIFDIGELVRRMQLSTVSAAEATVAVHVGD
jgi:hypothetical protein